MRFRHCRIIAGGILFFPFLLCKPAVGQQSASDWQAQVRAYVAAKRLDSALALVNQRLAKAPDDLEARGWRARLWAWSNRWSEAESEYRSILERAPRDTDFLLGLADLLTWQHRYGEALSLLERAQQVEPERVDIYPRRGRVLREQGQVEAAREAFQQALVLDPSNAEAQAGLRSLEPKLRHEFRINGDFDHFPFAQDAQSIVIGVRSEWNSHWVTQFAGNFQHRFGERAGAFQGGVSYRFGSQNTLSIGGSAGQDEGIIPKGEAYFEYDRGFRLGNDSAVRGLELGYRQRWLWFRDAQALVLTPYSVVYFPKNWYWYLAITAARTRNGGGIKEWQPSGLTRVNFPIHRSFSGNLFFGVGTENFSLADQVGRFSARTYGGGLRWQLSSRQDLSGYGFYQDRSQGRTETGFGFSYGLRF